MREEQLTVGKIGIAESQLCGAGGRVVVRVPLALHGRGRLLRAVTPSAPSGLFTFLKTFKRFSHWN